MWLLYFSIYFQKKKGYRDYLKSEFKKIGNSDFNEIAISTKMQVIFMRKKKKNCSYKGSKYDAI